MFGFIKDMSVLKIDKTLDIKGLVNPRPTIITEHTLREMNPGQVLRVITNDVSTKRSIPELCKGRGYKLLELQEEAGALCFIIQK